MLLSYRAFTWNVCAPFLLEHVALMVLSDDALLVPNLVRAADEQFW